MNIHIKAAKNNPVFIIEPNDFFLQINILL